MSSRSQLGLLMFRTISRGNIPPYPPPGPMPPRDDARTAVCPTCNRKAVARAGGRFYCENCGRYFSLH